MLINEKKAKLLIQDTAGKIFHAEFIKQDNTVREMSARLDVTSYLKGGELAYNPSHRSLIVVFDMQKQAYRMIPVKRLLSLTIQGKRYVVKHRENQS